jgi:hypothetical protein
MIDSQEACFPLLCTMLSLAAPRLGEKESRKQGKQAQNKSRPDG